MTDIRLLAIDLDDTLVREDNTISDYTRSILKKVQAKGIHIVIATGACTRRHGRWGSPWTSVICL